MTEALEAQRAGDRRGTGRTRMCAVTRKVRPEAELIRFVAAPDGSVVADLKAKLPGRGIWIGAERTTVEAGVKRNVFRRGLKQALEPDVDLADKVAERLKAAALGRLGLARKARAVVTGFKKVEAAILGEPLLAIVIAADAADDGVRKIRQALYRRFGETGLPPVFAGFRSEELGLAMGLPNVIHAAVLQGPAGRSFVEAATRLQRYEGAGGDGRNPAPADVGSGRLDLMDE